MNRDDWGEVINGQDTYEELANSLRHEYAHVIGWTDEQMTHLDILFTLYPMQTGSLQRGLRGATDLFVSIPGFGCHGFTVKPGYVTDAGYVAEKFGNRPANVTWERVAELINGVINEIRP